MPIAGSPRALPALPAEPPDWPSDRQVGPLQVVKLAPDGSFVTQYQGELLPGAAPRPWLAVRAVWTHPVVVLDGLAFNPGDLLIEYFSPVAWFNVFAVHDPDGGHRGWYANVTYPTRFNPDSPPTLTWHDLYLDVVARPGVPPVVRDEDELAASGLKLTEPTLYRRIVAARDEILTFIAEGRFPFPGTARTAGA